MLALITLGTGLFAGALLLGFKHGFDWDHIIAITDIASTQESRRRGLFLGSAYVFGHAVMILVLGTVAIIFGSRIPPGVDDLMGRVVGITLILLGVAVLATVATDRGSFAAKSRWLLLFSAVRRLFTAIRLGMGLASQTEHEHNHDSVHHELDPTETGASHTHPHSHDVTGATGVASTVGIGMLHGIGAETPTQVLLFLAAATAGTAAGIGALAAFVIGLVVANSIVTIVASTGLASLAKRPGVQIALGVIAGVFSIVVGVLFFLGSDTGLPEFF